MTTYQPRPGATIAAKREQLQAVERSMNDVTRREAHELLDAISERATRMADAECQRIAEQLAETRRAQLIVLTETRDESERIAAELKRGRIDPAAGARTLAELRQRREEAEARLARAGSLADRIEELEAAPESMLDDLIARGLVAAPDWSW